MMRITPWISVLALAGLVAVGCGRSEQKAAPADGRQRLALPPEAREKVLAEMRMMLESVSAIIQALGSNDMSAVQHAAHGAGMHAAVEADPEIRKQLPKEWLDLGDQTHQKLDELAQRLGAGGSRDDALKALGAVTGTCVACHATYRLDDKR